MTRVWALVPAAGRGARLGGEIPKQYLSFGGKRLIEHTLTKVLSYQPIEQCLVMLSAEDTCWAELPIAQHKKIVEVAGGDERMNSVYQGLLWLKGKAQADDWVLVHDAARALIQVSDIQRLMDAVSDHPVGGLLGVPVRDTLKSVRDGCVSQTISRDQVWHALTPQVFRYEVLRAAYESATALQQAVTDEAQAIECMGGKPLMVKCESLNLKLTYQEDMKVFASVLGELADVPLV